MASMMPHRSGRGVEEHMETASDVTNASAECHPSAFNKSPMAMDIQAKFELLVSSELCSGSGNTSGGAAAAPSSISKGDNDQVSSQAAGITAPSAVSTGGEAPLLPSPSNPEARANSTTSRVVLDAWTAELQEDETGALGLFVGGFVAGAAVDGRVICNAPVCQRITSHELELEDGTHVSLCGAPDTEEMTAAGSCWLCSLVLNGLPADWEEQLQDILQQQAEHTREGESQQTPSGLAEPPQEGTTGKSVGTGQNASVQLGLSGDTPDEEAEIPEEADATGARAKQSSHSQEARESPEDCEWKATGNQKIQRSWRFYFHCSVPGCPARKTEQAGKVTFSGEHQHRQHGDKAPHSTPEADSPAVKAQHSTRSASRASDSQTKDASAGGAGAKAQPCHKTVAANTERLTKPSGQGKVKDGAVLTTRSGRVCLTPLEFWRNERIQQNRLQAGPLVLSAALTPNKMIKAPRIKAPPARPSQGAKKQPARPYSPAARAPQEEPRRPKRGSAAVAAKPKQPQKRRRNAPEAGGKAKEEAKRPTEEQEETGADVVQRSSYVKNVIKRVRESKPASGVKSQHPTATRAPASDGKVIFQRPRRAAASAAATHIRKCATGKDPTASATAAACDEALRERAEEAAEAKRAARSAARAAAEAAKPKPKAKAQKRSNKPSSALDNNPEDAKQSKAVASKAHKQLSARDMGLGVKAPRMKGRGVSGVGHENPQKASASSGGQGGDSAGTTNDQTGRAPPESSGDNRAASNRNEAAAAVPTDVNNSPDRDVDGWTQAEVASLQRAWAATDPVHPNFWAAVSKNVAGRTAAECFNKHMNKHGPSPVVHASKPRRYLATLEQATAAVRGGASGKPTKAQTRKLVRHMRWQQRASELNLNVTEESGASGGTTSLTSDVPGAGESHQGFLAAMGRQERTDQYIEGILRRQRKVQFAARAKGKAPQCPTQHNQQQISRLELQIQEALAAASSGEDMDDEEDEKDFYFSDDEAGTSGAALPSTAALGAVKLSTAGLKDK